MRRKHLHFEREKRQRKHVKGKPLHIPVGIQLKYTNAIDLLVQKMVIETKRDIAKLFNEDFATRHFAHDSVGMDSGSFDSQVRILINRTKRQYDQLFGKLAMGLSPWMADAVNRASSDTTRHAVEGMPNLREEGNKLSIDIATLSKQTKTLLNVAASASSEFIKTIPETYLNKVASAVYHSIVTGNGMQDLQPFFDKQESSIKNWAHNTAMDQTRKTYNGLNLGRMQKIGITKGTWIHSGGSQHPRELHEDADGEIFDLEEGLPIGDDGENVVPGESPNCRCTFAPVVVFEDDE